MIYYVSADARRNGIGTKDSPFMTIQEAANLAMPGDEVLVSPGIYREYVNPLRGGTEEARITYRSIVPRGAIITGAEPVKNWKHLEGNVYMARISNGVFGNYNPYTTVIHGDWYNSKKPVHTGEVYLNGKSLYEVFSLDEVKHPTVYTASWDPEWTVNVWYTEQDNGFTVIYANFQGKDPTKECVEINVRRNCFYPAEEGKGYITLSGFIVKQAATTWAPPTAYQEGMIGPHWSKGWIIENCEVSDSKCSGISLGKYLQPNNENKWSLGFVKNGTQTERDAICQAQREGWTKERIGSHIIRGCDIHDCGQTGIVGHLGGVFSIIEDNHIHHINNKQDLAGAEIGGIKMHAAIDVIIRRNHFHHCTRGLWLDWQAQGTRVTQNLFHDNMPPAGTFISNDLALAEDIFVEVSHGPTLIDHNILLSAVAARLATQGLAFVHNLIAGSFTMVGQGTDNGGIQYPTPRYTPYHVPHRTEVDGFMTILHGDARFYNNIFVQQPISEEYTAYARSTGNDRLDLLNFIAGTKPYDGYPTHDAYFSQFTYAMAKNKALRDLYYMHLPVYTGGNVFFGGAKPCDTEENYQVVDCDVTISLVEKDGQVYLDTNLFDALPVFELQMVDTDLLGEAFEPEQKFESPDGTPILFDRDYFGKKRGVDLIAGPFASIDEWNQPLF